MSASIHAQYKLIQSNHTLTLEIIIAPQDYHIMDENPGAEL